MLKETAIKDKIADQARQLIVLFVNNSESEFIHHADEILLILNRISDLHKSSTKYAPSVNAMNDIIRGLESDPGYTLRQREVQMRLRSFFPALLKSSNK